ncbi:phosphate propanoyltransferase [bacterium]|nr:phosphate propanoyltransferase [bacterium]
MREKDVYDKKLVRSIVKEVLGKLSGGLKVSDKIPVGLSNRHLHLTIQDIKTLFSKGARLTKLRDLSQPGQFAANEVIILVGPKGRMDKVRILGPVRKETQVEISRTDSYTLGIKPPVRISGNVKGSSGVKIIGPKGEIDLKEGVIIAQRHIHMSPDEARSFGVKDGDIVRVQVPGKRALIFDNVMIRSGPTHRLDFHIDIDEANAAELSQGDLIEIIKS